VKACHVVLDNVFVAQFGSASSMRCIIELPIEDILGQTTIFHTVDVTWPAQMSLPYDSSKVI